MKQKEILGIIVNEQDVTNTDHQQRPRTYQESRCITTGRDSEQRELLRAAGNESELLRSFLAIDSPREESPGIAQIYNELFGFPDNCELREEILEASRDMCLGSRRSHPQKQPAARRGTWQFRPSFHELMEASLLHSSETLGTNENRRTLHCPTDSSGSEMRMQASKET